MKYVKNFLGSCDQEPLNRLKEDVSNSTPLQSLRSEYMEFITAVNYIELLVNSNNEHNIIPNFWIEYITLYT